MTQLEELLFSWFDPLLRSSLCPTVSMSGAGQPPQSRPYTLG